MNYAEIIAIIVSGLFSIGATLITNSKSNTLQTERISVLQDSIKQLSTKVEQHNNFGLQLAKLETRVDALEKGKE